MLLTRQKNDIKLCYVCTGSRWVKDATKLIGCRVGWTQASSVASPEYIGSSRPHHSSIPVPANLKKKSRNMLVLIANIQRFKCIMTCIITNKILQSSDPFEIVWKSTKLRYN